ncbi:MAG TPA: glycosyl hydrolase, partial [Flavobacteriaceae bacterium]|nr:glycosyl hydrolase [Flavobacteriaceae bacterium]
DVEVVGIAEPDQRMIDRSNKIFTKYKKKTVEYFKGLDGYKKLYKNKKIHAVIIATPWEFHAEQTIAAMNAGKIVGLEVCGAMNLQEC